MSALPSIGDRVWVFLASHPVILLLLLTPGIPEYLSGSSAINTIVFNPVLFVFQVVANLGLYGPGAILIHEAKVRWKKGWASVLLLGAAYGILEEGVALDTMFNPNAGPVGALGAYGHLLGVNWIWSAGIVPFHALWSIALPILLLGLALPETVDKRLLSKKGTSMVVAILMFDVLGLMLFVFMVSGYWMGLPILLGSFVVMALLVLVARRIPANALGRNLQNQRASYKKLAVVGASFFPAVLLTQGLGEGTKLPAVVDFCLVLAVQALYLFYLTNRSPPIGEKAKIVLVSGLLVPIIVFGVVAEIALPLNLIAVLLLVLFLRKLWKMYPLIPPSPIERVVPSTPQNSEGPKHELSGR